MSKTQIILRIASKSQSHTHMIFPRSSQSKDNISISAAQVSVGHIIFFFFLISLFLPRPDEVQSQISLRDISSDQNRAKQSFLGQWTQEEEKTEGENSAGGSPVPQGGRQRRSFQHI